MKAYFYYLDRENGQYVMQEELYISPLAIDAIGPLDNWSVIGLDGSILNKEDWTIGLLRYNGEIADDFQDKLQDSSDNIVRRFPHQTKVLITKEEADKLSAYWDKLLG